MDIFKKIIVFSLLIGLISSKPQQYGVRTELYFGLTVPGSRSMMPDQVWQDFVDSTLSTSLSGGSIVDTYGWFKTKRGYVVKEKSKLVVYVGNGTPEESAKIDTIRSIYKKKFHQTSVLRVDTRADLVSF